MYVNNLTGVLNIFAFSKLLQLYDMKYCQILSFVNFSDSKHRIGYYFQLLVQIHCVAPTLPIRKCNIWNAYAIYVT